MDITAWSGKQVNGERVPRGCFLINGGFPILKTMSVVAWSDLFDRLAGC
jgi:hypothetical protein